MDASRLPTELWADIFAYLRKPSHLGRFSEQEGYNLGDLVPVPRACRRFYDIATPLIYERVFLFMPTPQNLDALLRLGAGADQSINRMIRTLSILRWGIHSALFYGKPVPDNWDSSPMMIGLRNVILNAPLLCRLNLTDVLLTKEMLLQFASLCHLQELHINSCLPGGINRDDIPTGLYVHLTLASLTITFRDSDETHLFPYICELILLPTLLELHVDRYFVWLMSTWSGSPLDNAALELKRLSIIHLDKDHPIRLSRLLVLLRLYPHLESLSIPGLIHRDVSRSSIPSFDALRRFIIDSQLTSAFGEGKLPHTVGIYGHHADSEFAPESIRAMAPSMKSLVLIDLKWNVELLERISSLCPLLEILRLEMKAKGLWRFIRKHIESHLKGFARLQQFRIVVGGLDEFSDDARIDEAEAVMRCGRVCRSLTEMQLLERRIWRRPGPTAEWVLQHGWNLEYGV